VESIREIPIVARAELYRMLRSARTIVLLGLYCLFSTLVLLIVGSSVPSPRRAGECWDF